MNNEADINLELYKTFIKVAENNSFSKAARLLFISQSAVSQSIRQLENKLGHKLFIRKNKNVMLTKEGEILYNYVSRAYSIILAAQHAMSEMKNLQSGHLTIAVSDTICKHYLMPFIHEFISRYPSIKLQIFNRTSSQILSLIESGKADLGIITMQEYSSGISLYEWIKVEDIFAASREYCTNNNLINKAISLQELTSFPLLLLDKNSSTRKNLDRYLASLNLFVEPELELESNDLLIEFAKCSKGIAHVLKKSVLKDISEGQLVEINLLESLPCRHIAIALPNSYPVSTACRMFLKLLNIKYLE